MKNIKAHLTIACLILVSCGMNPEQEVSPETIQMLSGTWVNHERTGSIYFYKDKTAKLLFPQHQPPIKLISPYQAVKEHKIGIALGGFWSGPLLIDTTDINTKTINVRFPDEEAITFHKEVENP